MTQPIAESELILNPDGSIFHLHLFPDQLADLIILVGDQGRVEQVSSHFSRIDCKVSNREFITHTGWYNDKRVSVVSTGIGTDNIDIVINELDALANIDLQTRTIKSRHHTLNFVRIGTSGALQPDVDVDSFVFSRYGIGFDGLLHFYNFRFADEELIADKFINDSRWPRNMNLPYVVKSSDKLAETVGRNMMQGITATACGFYGPQGRQLRLNLKVNDLNERLTAFRFEDMRITNFEMETSALYGLSKLLGHHAATVCAIIANRIKKEYSKDYKKAVDKLIIMVLDRLTE